MQKNDTRPPLGFLKIAGSGAKKLLQGQLTCDLEKLTPTANHCLGAYCNPQGRIISFFRLFLQDDSYYLQLPKNLIAITTGALQKFAPFYQVTLDDVSDFANQLGLPQDTFYSIQAGIPAIYPETSGQYFCHELGLHLINAISFDKGCYSGQEIISRMHYLGKQKNQLYRGRIHGNHPTLGADIYSDLNIIGSIVDYAEIDYNTFELLFVAQKSVATTSALYIDTMKMNMISAVHPAHPE